MSTGSVGQSLRTALRSHQSWTGPMASTSRLMSSVAPFNPSAAAAAADSVGPVKAVGTTAAARHLATCTCSPTPSAAIQTRSYSSRPTPRAAPSSSSAASRRKRTIMDLDKLKRQGIPITVLTAHDYSSARFIESSFSPAPVSHATASNVMSAASSTISSAAATTSPPRGIDICLVGDSLAMVACGYQSTTDLSLDEMLYHCRSVARGCHSSLLVADLPFGTYHTSPEQCSQSAVRLIQEGQMDGVKLEGGQEVADLVQRLTSRGIPVMGHVGLTPQRQASLSGYRVQGKTVSSAMKIYQDALAIQATGAFAMVIEAVPSRLAAFISQRLRVPTIGIGGGKDCDGQVLVQLDMLGVSSLAKGPRFLKKYAEWEPQATQAIRQYVSEVRERSFPVEEEHGYPMLDEEWQGFLEAVGETDEIKN
ncbi:BQ2448_3710 [Microbotryum intermedium]|uniref:3-methyl-2-oxobutanoate hydroxymethyltransferase n=1 Tax=Microbotryum intermedium TaxID=269621 RepID=A0A238FID4_9BASI|nr:BQ2448_3710 [Microbotryum intermedium]